MAVEERHLLFHGCLDRDLLLDVGLRSVFDSDEAETQLDILVHNSALSIGAAVHDVDLGDDTDSTDTLRIDFPRHSQTLLGCHVSVRSHNTKNDGS